MSNLLIVESENDKFFVEALIAHMNINIKVGYPICTIDEYDCIGGMGKLKYKFEELRSRLLKGDEINRVGIIFDADKTGINKRTQEINKIKNSVFSDGELDLKIFIMNINGNGELETLVNHPTLKGEASSKLQLMLDI